MDPIYEGDGSWVEDVDSVNLLGGHIVAWKLTDVDLHVHWLTRKTMMWLAKSGENFNNIFIEVAKDEDERAMSKEFRP